MKWHRWAALVLCCVAMVAGTGCFVLLIIKLPLGAWDVPVEIGACVGVLGMVLVGPVAERL